MSSTRPSGLPRQTYSFPGLFEDYMKDQMGITVGHQGFDNNILAAEAFMKLLPQIKLAKDRDFFKNRFNRKGVEYTLSDTAFRRITQVYRDGLLTVIHRNDDNPNKLDRTAMYKFPNKVTPLSINNEVHLLEDVYEVQKTCHVCDKPLWCLANSNDLGDIPQHGILVCSGCDYTSEVEIETKPSLSLMRAMVPVNSNPVWVWIRGEVLVRYAWESLDPETLASDVSGIYDIIEIGPIKKKVKRYETMDQILTSINTTNRVSHKYYQRTMDLLFYSEFLTYYNILLLDAYQLYRATKTPQTTEQKRHVPRIE